MWRIRDVYPRSRILIFAHPGSRIQKQQQKTGVKKFFFCQTIFCSHKFHKTEYYLIFDKLKKKIWPNFPRIIEVFTQKIVTKPSKIRVWDPRSGIRKKPIPDPGSRGQKGTGSRIRIRNNAFRIRIRKAECKQMEAILYVQVRNQVMELQIESLCSAVASTQPPANIYANPFLTSLNSNLAEHPGGGAQAA